MNLYQDSIDRAERVARATRQEQQLVVRERNKGNLAWRIAREIDVIILQKNGVISLVDCKFSDNGEFWIDWSDIVKGLDYVRWLVDHGLPARFRIDMHFPRTRQKNNRRYIDMDESCRDWSMRVWYINGRIMTKLVRRGGIE